MHVRVHNTITYILGSFMALILIMEFDGSDPVGEKYYIFFLLFLIGFIAYYVYKNRSNLPIPKSVTKDSMEDYQKQQLKRYLASVSSFLWWGALPILHGFMGLFAVKHLSGFNNFVLVVIAACLVIWMMVQNRIWFKKFNQQYEELGGKIDTWFKL